LKRIGLLKPDRLVDLLNWIGLPVFVLYLFGMVIFPLFDGKGDWGYVQNVWSRWQGLNVGMLAFISSITAFNISRYNANRQRERDFLAAKAFLPDALSELIDYFESSALIFIQGLKSNRENLVTAEPPILPANYKEVFGNCIRYADPDVGDYLARLLVKLQVHNSRLKNFITYFNAERNNLISYLYRLGELQALVNKLFGFARSEEDFDSGPLEWEDFRNAYKNLKIPIADIYIDDDMNLEAFTKRAISRNKKENT